jgi:23S rRNA (cytidine1920-2'-O)/16S rRNA (cytidine1409-2'-O)-methyltransferase
MRLDQRVAETLGTSRNRAQFFIEHGLVNVAGKVSQKCAMEVAPDTELQIDRDHPQIRYVSRSAEKLASFLDATGISVEGFQCLDVGASTGGFTQVLLERSAAQVVAVDVGTAQLHERLRGDSRIVSLENTDIRNWKSEEKFARITVDVSFVSLREVLPSILGFLEPEGICVALFKPQFEVGPENLKKTGIPKSEEIRLRAVRDFETWLEASGIPVFHQHESGLIGEAGNREVLFAVGKR